MQFHPSPILELYKVKINFDETNLDSNDPIKKHLEISILLSHSTFTDISVAVAHSYTVFFSEYVEDCR
jgi:hypothetical protein